MSTCWPGSTALESISLEVDRLDLDAVDDEHAGVVGDQVDEDARLRQHLDRVRHGRDALDLVGQLGGLVAGDRHDHAEPDEHEPDGDARAGERAGRDRSGAGGAPTDAAADPAARAIGRRHAGAVIVGGSLAMPP